MRFSNLALGLALVAGAVGCTALLGDFSVSSTGVDAGGSEGGADALPSEAGGDDGATAADGGDGGDAAVSWSCAIDTAYQRSLTGDAGTIAADYLYVYRQPQSGSIALVKTGNDPSLAYGFRPDRPGDAPLVVPLQLDDAGSNGSARLVASARSADDTATYVLAADHQNDLLFYDWPDNGPISNSPQTAAAPINLQGATFAPTSSGALYAFAVNSGSAPGPTGSFVDFPSTAFPSMLPTTTQISAAVDTGLGDGARTYVLSDGSVMLLWRMPDGSMHQSHFPSLSTTPSVNRQLYAGMLQPVSFQTNGTNVDVAVAMAPGDAGTTFGLFTATMPESQLFTFDPATDLKQVTTGMTLTTQPCITSFPGKLALLVPDTSGMDMMLIDTATASVPYSLTGASNLLHGDSSIVRCALTPTAVSASKLSFDVIWTENGGGGGQNLLYAPLVCTAQ